MGDTKVLLVDDDVVVARAYQKALTQFGYNVVVSNRGADAVAALTRDHFEAVISDISMPEMDGLQFLRAVREQDLDVPVILMTGSPSLDSAMRAVEYGAFRYLLKPVDLDELDATVRRAIQLHALARLKREALSVGEDQGKTLGDPASLEARFSVAMKRATMVFQPIVSFREKKVFGYEALVRSNEPSLRAPVHLLDAAERLGREHELGRLVRKTVAKRIASQPGDWLAFVNLHPIDLNDEELFSPDAPLSAIAKRTVLEVTERSSLHGVHGVASQVARLRALGFRIAVDDLGAGYAGLSSFTLLEPEIVKLDMSLIRGIEEDPRRQHIVRSMRTLARDLGMWVIAEGVETVAERDVLVTLGCDLLQGYLFGMPDLDFAPPIWGA